MSDAGGGGTGLVAEPFEGDGGAWDAFVREAGGTFCHLSGWRAVMSDALGHECLYRLARGPDGTLRGVLPLVCVRSRIFGHYLLSVPFLNYGGPLGDDAARAFLGRVARDEAEERRVDLLELRSRAAVGAGLETSDRKVTVVLDLPEDATVLWERGLRAKVRSQVRRPQKEGMVVQFGAEQLDAFYGVFARTMRDLGTPVLARRFFTAIRDTFAREVVFAAVYWRGAPLAAGCGFLFEGEFEITWAGALREHAAKAPNMLLYWSLMEEMIRSGAHTFNFGRCTRGSGTYRFKLQWGGREVPLPWAQWSSSGVTAPPSPDRPLLRLATSAWRRLPLPIANGLGPSLARVLP